MINNALVNFCEKRYIYSNYISEFYNTITGVIYIYIGFYWLIYLNYKNNFLNKLCYTSIFIGIGTILLHATNNYYMELIDEISMIFFIKLLLNIFENLNQEMYLINKISIFSIYLGIPVYLYNCSYLFFKNFFTFIVVISFINWYLIYLKLQQESEMDISNKINYNKPINKIKNIFKIFFISKIIWLIEQNLCIYYQPLYILHALWHLSTGYVIHLIIYFFYEIKDIW